jgi:hypothetical protein
MDDLERVTNECLQRINTFGLENAAVIITNAKAKAAFAAIGEYVAELDKTGALRTSAGITKLSQTGFRRMKRTQLKGFALKISQAARDNEKNNPAFVNKFHINHKNLNDSVLLETARSFYADSETVEQDFKDYGFPDNFRLILKTLIEEFEQAINEQDSAHRARVGANAAIDDIIDRALSGRRTLLVIVPNLFADNPGKLAEWAAASHIEKLSKGKPKNPPTP